MSISIEAGLIGFGMAGKVFHAPYLHTVEGFRLSMIRTTNPGDMALAKHKYPDAVIVKSSEEIFENLAIALVVIATPNSLHFELAKAALLAGKHVVVDKPFTTTSAEAEELIGLAASRGKVLSIYQNRRWDSDFLTLKKVIDSKVLGKLVSFHAHFDRFRNIIKEGAWKEKDLPGSGILYDLGSHLIDQAVILFGKPAAISADISIQRPGGHVPDFFELHLVYPEIRVKLTAGMLVRPPAIKYLLSGLNGSYVKHGMDVQEDALKAGALPTLPNLGEEPEALWGQLNTIYEGLHFFGKVESEKGDYNRFYQNIKQAIEKTQALEVTAEQAKFTIQLIEAAIKSHAEKRIVVL